MDISSLVFRDQVVAAETLRPEPVDAASVWDSLCVGTTEIRGVFSTVDRHYFVTASRAVPHGRVEGRQRRILEAVLHGAPPKTLSYDLNLSNSTIAGELKQCLHCFGLDCLPSHTPILLLMIANAAREQRLLEGGIAAELAWEGTQYRSISASRPEATLRKLLPPAEFSVISMLINGASHKTMAAVRHRSPRTIANQLASAFQRLGVSGRGGVLAQLVAQRAPGARAAS